MVIKVKGYFKAKDIQVLLRTKTFQVKGSLFLFFLLNVVQKLVFPLPCFCAVTSALSACQGNGRGGGWSCVAVAVLARAGLAQPCLFPWDDIIPFCELMMASRDGTGNLHTYWQKDSEMLMCFSNQVSCCASSCQTSSCSCPTFAKTGSLTSACLVCCACVFPRSLTHALQVIVMQLSSSVFSH